jgi:hypothetical protein
MPFEHVTPDQLRREADDLREAAFKLVQKPAILINKSADLDKQILHMNPPKAKKS